MIYDDGHADGLPPDHPLRQANPFARDREFRVVALIPARGTSRRVRDKNMQRVAGRTLVQRAIDSVPPDLVTHIYVSSDDHRIGRHADANGARWLPRPAYLAGPRARVEDAIAYHLEQRDWDAFVLLNPTSPFRSVASVTKSIVALAEGAPSVVGVVRDPMIHFRGHVEGGQWLPQVIQSPRPRTQDVDWYRENGAIFGVRREPWELGGCELITEQCSAIIMSEHESIDINTLTHLRAAQRQAEGPVSALLRRLGVGA